MAKIMVQLPLVEVAELVEFLIYGQMERVVQPSQTFPPELTP